MSLVLYDTLTRTKAPFEPIEPGKVTIYCCGVTVYDYSHLGHARCYITWDVVRRYLMWRGYDVHYVQNFTDIDDKILNRAKTEDSSMKTVAEKYTATYFEDMERLNVLEADDYTYATQTLDGIQRLISELEQKGYAYPAAGDVYYSVRRFDGYGKLSGRKLADMQAGASGRVAVPQASASPQKGLLTRLVAFIVTALFLIGLPLAGALLKGWSLVPLFTFAALLGAIAIGGLAEILGVINPAPAFGTVPKKQDPFDFALWKGAKPGEPFWESPWGPGRPGWHIECSAMIRDRFGPSIDIHTGGSDLVFPHHENEIAQSEAATEQPLARYWMHNGMVNVGGEKMSKSLGNFTTIRQLLDSPSAPDPMAVRLFLLQGQYRKPVDFTDEAIAAAQNGWQTLLEGLRFGYDYGAKLGWADVDDSDFGNAAAMRIDRDAAPAQQFQAAMDDDFNTSGALAVLFDLAKDLRRAGNLITHAGQADTDADTLRQQWQTLVCLAQVLGLEAQPVDSSAIVDGPSDEDIEAMLAQRKAAREAKDFAESDRIRDELKAQGITLIDKPGGVTEWHR